MTSSDIGIDARVSRLAQYRPFQEGGVGLTSALQRFIFGVAELDGGDFGSLASCRDSLRSLWNLDFEIEEIGRAADELAERGLCERTRGGFRLSPELMDRIRSDAAESRDIEERAFDDWRKAVLDMAPQLSSTEIEELRTDLMAWLGKIVVRHGVEAALVLYPENARARQLIGDIEAEGLRFLPTRSGAVGEVREDALRQFVRNPTEAQRIYLDDRLQASFDLTVLTLDPAARDLAREQFKSHRVYLDTNFLYAVLGFAPATESLAAHRLLQLTKDLGFDLAITPWTVDELRTSLHRSQTGLERISLPSRDYADLMVAAASEKGFDRAFWIAYRDSNMSRQDFFDRASHFHRDLEKLGIAVDDRGCDRVQARTTEVAEYVELLNAIKATQVKELVVLQHDAKHRVLIEQLRGDGRIEFSNARYWFLTQDTRLPVFARIQADGKTENITLPFCMTTSVWAQVMRAFTPRTTDWERLVVDLLASPYVGWHRGVSLPAVLEVVARVDQYDADSLDLAFEVVADSAKMAEIGDLRSSGATQAEVAEVIDAAFVAEAEAAKASARLARQREAEAEAAAKTEQERADELAANLQAEQRRRETAEGELVAERGSADRRLQALDAAHATAAAKQAEIEDERERRIKLEGELEAAEARRVEDHRRTAAVALILVSIGAPAALLGTAAVHGAAATIAVIVGGVLGICAGVNIAFSERWANRIFTTLGVLVGAVSIVVAVLLAHSSGGGGPTVPTFRYFVAIPAADTTTAFTRPSASSLPLGTYVQGNELSVECLVPDLHVAGVVWAKLTSGAYFPVSEHKHVLLTPGADGSAPACKRGS